MKDAQTAGIGIYSRISLDDGTALGVQRQEEDCEKLAALRGWSVAKVYRDNDVSAYKRNVRRPAFENLLKDLAAGRLSGLVVYDLDRLSRQPRDLERVIDLYDRSGLTFATVSGDIDLGSPDGLTMARVMVAFANKSSADTARRVARKHLENALKGKPVGGTRPFGWEDDKVTLRPEEAAAIREGVRMLLSGRSLHSVVRYWNGLGLTTSKGNQWNTSTARQMLKSPRLAGYRVHQGKLLHDEDGGPVRGIWSPIIELATWASLMERFESSKAKAARPGSRAYLLSGIIRCGACGTPLRHNAQTAKGTRYYACPSPSQGGCGKVGVSAPKVEQIVEEAFIERWGGFEIVRTAAPFPRAAELEQKQQQITDLMGQFTSGSLGPDVVFPSVEKLEAELVVLRMERAAWDSDHPAGAGASWGPASNWDAQEVAEKRAKLEALLLGIAVRPAASRGGAFNPERVHVAWKELPRSASA